MAAVVVATAAMVLKCNTSHGHRGSKDNIVYVWPPEARPRTLNIFDPHAHTYMQVYAFPQINSLFLYTQTFFVLNVSWNPTCPKIQCKDLSPSFPPNVPTRHTWFYAPHVDVVSQKRPRTSSTDLPRSSPIG